MVIARRRAGGKGVGRLYRLGLELCEELSIWKLRSDVFCASYMRQLNLIVPEVVLTETHPIRLPL